MNHACQMLMGEHDFASFVTGMGDEEKSTVRHVLKAEMGKDGELAIFNMVANSFLRHQVRNTVGSLISIGKGRLTIDEFQRIIEAREPGLAGPAAPARGLHLKRVDYPSPLEEGIS
jgi:tRNA pseudouridine38-40 synthase